MTRSEWRFSCPEEHVVCLTHGFWSGKATIELDGKEIFRRPRKLWDMGFEHRFEVAGVPCIIRVFSRLTGFEYELWVDGKLK